MTLEKGQIGPVGSTDSSAWLGIATAPKDGTNILASDGELIALVWWSDEWRDYGDIGAAGRYEFSPTHWMHLPPLPNTQISHAPQTHEKQN